MLSWLTGGGRSSDAFGSQADVAGGEIACSVGAQDQALQCQSTRWCMSEFLQTKHSEMPLLIEPEEGPDGRIYFDIPTGIHAVNDLVLVIGSSEEVLDRVQLVVGGALVDGFNCQGHRAAAVSSALWNRRAETIDGVTFLPLPFTLTHPKQFMPVFPLSDVQVTARLHKKTWTRLAVRSITFLQPKCLDFRVATHEHRGPFGYDIFPGTNTIELPFSHPTTHVALWGVDEDAIQRVKLLFNGKIFIDADVRSLQYERLARSPSCKALVLYLTSSDISSPDNTYSAVNMSRLAFNELVVETSGSAGHLYVMSFNINVMRSFNERLGQEFAN